MFLDAARPQKQDNMKNGLYIEMIDQTKYKFQFDGTDGPDVLVKALVSLMNDQPFMAAVIRSAAENFDLQEKKEVPDEP